MRWNPVLARLWLLRIAQNPSIARHMLAKNFLERQRRANRIRHAVESHQLKYLLLTLLLTGPIVLATGILYLALSYIGFLLQRFQIVQKVSTSFFYISEAICKNVVLSNRRILSNLAKWFSIAISALRRPTRSSTLQHAVLLGGGKELDLKSVVLLDTGCSTHTFADSTLFKELRLFESHEKTHSIVGIGNTILWPSGIGTATLQVSINSQPHTLNITKVYYCPELQANLVSAGQLIDNGVKITLRKHGCTVKTEAKATICEIRRIAGLFVLSTWYDYQLAMAAYSTSEDPIQRLWHERLGHIDAQTLKRLENMSTTFDPHIPKNTSCICGSCVRCALKDVSHRDTIANEATKPYEVIFSDVEGPFNFPSFKGYRYYVSFLDAYSKESEIYFMKFKSEVPHMYHQYKASKECPTQGRKIRRFHSDGGGEYLGTDFQNELKDDGIKFTYSVRASQQQNGAAERLNQTLITKAHKLLDTAQLDKRYWPLACQYANDIRNILPVANRPITPHEITTGKEPTHLHLRVFGCKVWYRYGSQERRKKFVDDKGFPGTFIGFEGTHIARILTEKDKIVRASAVIFEEHLTHPLGGTLRDQCLDPECGDDDPDSLLHTAWFSEEDIPINKAIPKDKSPHEAPTLEDRPTKKARRSQRVASRHAMNPPVIGRDLNERDHARIFLAHKASDNITTKADIRTHSYTSLAYKTIATTFALLTASAPPEPYEPKSWASAMKQPSAHEWERASKEEYNSLLENDTWSLVEPPPYRKILEARWVFKYKRGPNGDIIRYKARWVVKGYEQQLGLDYAETFASVVKPMSYKALFAIAASLDLEIEQMDVKTAFLYGSLDEEIFVEQPEGFHDGTNRVCRLNKALYGLKQSPRVWYHTLSDFLKNSDYHPLDADHSVFSNGVTFIAAYVDDLLIIGPDIKKIDDLKRKLSERFKMVNLGPVHHYLGMTVTRDRAHRVLRLGQRAYLEEAIRIANLWNSKPQLTPMKTERLEPAPNNWTAKPEFKKEYQTHVGTLMYAMLGTRPDIAFAVACVSRYASNPTDEHMTAVKRIFAYLRDTLNYELTYRGDIVDLTGYSDSDWGGDTSTYRSTAGFVFNIGSGAISWSSKRQPTVALSTCEAEYRAQTHASKEAIWLRQLLQSLIPQEETPFATIVYCDNQSAIALAKDPKFHARTKYIAVEEHWIREKIQDNTIELQYIQTSKQVADGLTKALPKDAFIQFRDALGLESILPN
jgi:transposase InsO family protein